MSSKIINLATTRQKKKEKKNLATKYCTNDSIKKPNSINVLPTCYSSSYIHTVHKRITPPAPLPPFLVFVSFVLCAPDETTAISRRMEVAGSETSSQQITCSCSYLFTVDLSAISYSAWYSVQQFWVAKSTSTLSSILVADQNLSLNEEIVFSMGHCATCNAKSK